MTTHGSFFFNHLFKNLFFCFLGVVLLLHLLEIPEINDWICQFLDDCKGMKLGASVKGSLQNCGLLEQEAPLCDIKNLII
jgi:hypothetical protein